MIARLLGRTRGHPLLGALSTLGTKIGGSVAALAMFALASWTLDASAFGELVIAFNIVALAAVVAVLGQDTLIQRSWGEYVERDPALASGAIRFGLAVTGSGALAAVTLFALWAAFVEADAAVRDVAAIAAFLFTQTFLHFTANLGRVSCGVIYSEPARELFWRAPVALGLAAVLATGGRATVFAFFATAAAAQALSIVWLGTLVLRRLPSAVRQARPTFAVREWVGRSLTMAAAAMAEAAHQYADVILIGGLIGPDAAAGYFVVLRIAAIFSMLTAGIHTYSASRIAKLYYLEQIDELRRLLAQIAWLTTAITLALLAVVVVEGPLLLGIFGAGYRGLGVELTMMSLINGFVTLSGPGPMLMLLTGADLPYLMLVATALAIRIGALFLFAPTFGLDGAIFAVALALAPFSLAVALYSIRRIGVDPTALAALGRRGRNAASGGGA
ncbi:MAG: hypothetical protein LWW93_15795 [Hyphomicrobiales bacterium]|nr:hypothetical protein [Hyphomicrobiales bacterium]